LVAEFEDMAEAFNEESTELLDAMEESLFDIQDNGLSKENISAVFRAAHTVKGAAGMFELDYLVKFTHTAENLLDEIRNGRVDLTDDILDLFFKVKDQMQLLVDYAYEDETGEPPDDDTQAITADLLSQLEILLNGGTLDEKEEEPEPVEEEKTATPIETVEKKEQLSDEDFEAEIEKLLAQNEEKERLEDQKTATPIETVEKKEQLSDEDFEAEIEKLLAQNEEKERLEDEQAAKNEKKEESKPVEKPKPKPKPKSKPKAVADEKKQKVSTTLRVEASKIDTIINLVGEMVIANANVNQQASRVNDKKLIESVSIVSRMLEEIREATMKTRLIPIGETFSRFKRIVRDLSKDLGKNIDLEIIGAETELDKTVTEKISDPLIHLVRNSLDHGIEMPKDREAKGKSSKGKITLKAFHEAGNIAIQIIDDGKGLNPEWLYNKALDKGIISENDILTDKEKINLIMAAGFSTAEAITNVSGRGVGMDVVKRNIEELRGTIDLDSTVDVGTTMTIRLPLTLAIIDGFMTKIGEQFYIIPLEMIVECIELNEQYKKEILENNYINLRGNILPLLDLREFFDTGKANTKRENIVIVTFGGNTIGLLVDELHGEFQTVIKPLGRVFRNVKGIGGSTILGSGQVAMILDVPMLMQFINNISTNYPKEEKVNAK
jgi:two-component system chemotaxis sensor kinase CheA